ncbi:MAG: Ig-like domain-containing protein, partial [Planctomycetota bacterium]|nr:Ig-like domain-containing protein [Planctomycetota bacterium]
ATVRVTDALSGTVVFQGTTGSAGTVVASQLPEGYYSVEISAAKHHATRYTTFVAAGQSDQVSLFLARDLVRYTFQVVPTQIADQTKIVVQTEFEANVPAPVLVADPPVIDFADLVNPGDTKQTELTITNHGLIAALDVHLVISQNRFLKITPLITNFGSLAAKASITIPVLLERVATADETSELSGSDCVLMVELDWAMKYGGGKIGFQLPIPVINTGLDPTLCVREIYAGGGFSGGGGGGGGGSVGGTVEFREVVVSPVCCDPCVNALQKLLRDDVPYADWYTPLLSASDTSNALDFADDVLTSLAALGTDVTYVGPTLNLVAAWTSIRQTCLEGALGGAGTASSGITAIIALIDARVARFEAALDAYRDLFGADAWINASTGTKFNSWIARFTNAIDAASPSGRSVTTAERDGLTHGDLPEGIAAAAVNTMLDRWNRTAAYLANGITTTAQLGPSDNHDFIDRVVLRQLQQAAIAGESQNRADGFANAVDSIRDGMRILAGEINCVQPISACPRIRLQLDQTAIIVRNAFDATLELENSSGETLSGVEVQIVVSDLDGNDVTDRFQIRDGSGTSLVGGLVPAGQTGQGRWTIVPTRDAAPQFATSYKVGAILRYTSEGTRVITQLAPVTIAVLPDPVLQVHYFHQRDVFSDDPFTEAIEPSQPFNLAVMVANVGYGVANNVSIVSAQPKITDNDQGLLVDFKIIDTEVDGQNLSPSLTADFGAIQPGEITAARWLMTSTLQGQFIDYKATFEHVDGLGDKRLSLIDSVDIHEMIHLVTAAGAFDDGKYDYLVNDIPDVNDTPDTLFLSDGRILPVTPAANVSSDSAPVPGDLQVQLTATVGAGWNYFKTPDLGAGIYRLTRVVRSDGFEVPVGDNITGGNAWQTDRTFIERGLRPLNENTLHLLDFGGTGHYTLYYAPNDSVGPTVTSITTPASTVVDPVGSLTVTFSEPLLGGTFSSADLALFRDGNLTNLITSAVSISAISATQYQINGLAALNAVDGHYRLEVRAEGVTDLFGNAGTGVKTLEWTKADAAPTVASLTGPSAGPRNSAVAAVRVAFTRDLQADSLDAADLVLTRNGAVVDLAGTALTFTQTAANAFRVGGLTGVTTAEGNYVLTVLGTGVVSSTGLAGVGSRSITWTMDVTGPQVSSAVGLSTGLTNQLVDTFDVTFSESLAAGSFTAGDVRLTRGSQSVSTAGLMVTALASDRYRVTGLSAITQLDGSYRLSIAGSDVADAAANSGAGQFVRDWQLDRTVPAAATGLGVSPDTGVVGDRVTNVLAVRVTGNVAESPVSVAIYDDTTDSLLGTQQTNSGAFDIAVMFDGVGNQELRIVTTDAAGNSAAASYVVYIDQTPAFVASWGNIPSEPGAVRPDFIDM